MSQIKAISLFSGMGGDSLGIVNSNCKLVAYSECEEVFRQTHNANFKNCKLLGDGDITKTEDAVFKKYKNKVNLIFAGFPCQGFSNAGKKLPDDPRNTLFKEFHRATRLIEPNYIIGENVKGLLTKKTVNDELYIDVIKKEFESLGYKIYHKVMKCNLYGIPQNRHRLIIVGIKESLTDQHPFTFPEEHTSTPDIKHIIKFSMEGALKIEPEDFDFNNVPDECIIKDLTNDDTQSEEKSMKPHPNLVALAKVRDFTYNDKAYPVRLNFGKRIPVGGEVIDIRKPLNTIICTYARQPRFFVPQQNKNGNYLRCLLPDELKQIQGFPQEFKIEGDKNKQIIQIGNAVPPPLITQIINQIIT